MRIPGIIADAKTTPNIALSFVRDSVTQKLYKVPKMESNDFSIPENYEAALGRNSAHLVHYFPTESHY